MSSTIKVRSPFDGRELGEIAAQGADDVDRAVAAAHDARTRQPLPAWRRAEILTALSDMLGERREELAKVVSDEAAKPISLARTEVARALSTVGFAGVAARSLAGEVVPMEGSMVGEGKLAYTTRVPVGVVGAITPFNYPVNLVAHKVAPAIAAGNAVVLKPASQTPFSAFALAELFADCGLPDGWLNIVTGSGSEVGKALVEHPGVPLISFTGSAEVGWQMQALAPRKRVSLELGNSTPLIVEPDADLEEAAYGVAAAGFNFAGQSCISLQRVYVEESIAGEFTRMVADLVAQVGMGDPADEDVSMSSLISEAERDRVHAWIREAVDQGADLVLGGEIDGPLLSPALLVNTTLDMKVQSEEIFGPVVAMQTYGTLDEAIHLSNGTRYGLQAGIFTNNLQNALRATRELEFGGVLVNEIPTWRADIMPYGGVKDSGNTREGPAYAVENMTDPRLVVIDL